MGGSLNLEAMTCGFFMDPYTLLVAFLSAFLDFPQARRY